MEVDALVGAQVSSQPARPVKSGISMDTESPPSHADVAIAAIACSPTSSVSEIVVLALYSGGSVNSARMRRYAAAPVMSVTRYP